GQHRALAPAQVQALITLFSGVLLTLVAEPPEAVTPNATGAMARCLVVGVLATVPGLPVSPPLSGDSRPPGPQQPPVAPVEVVMEQHLGTARISGNDLAALDGIRRCFSVAAPPCAPRAHRRGGQYGEGEAAQREQWRVVAVSVVAEHDVVCPR